MGKAKSWSRGNNEQAINGAQTKLSGIKTSRCMVTGLKMICGALYCLSAWGYHSGIAFKVYYFQIRLLEWQVLEMALFKAKIRQLIHENLAIHSLTSMHQMKNSSRPRGKPLSCHRAKFRFNFCTYSLCFFFLMSFMSENGDYLNRIQ